MFLRLFVGCVKFVVVCSLPPFQVSDFVVAWFCLFSVVSVSLILSTVV